MSAEAPRQPAERWLRTVQGLRHHQLRVNYARSELQSNTPGELATALDNICRAADEGDQRAREVLIAFMPLLTDRALLGLVGPIRDYALERQLPAVSRLLRASTTQGHQARDEPDGSQHVIQDAGGRPLTLGERRSLARQSSRDQLDRLLRDPHPMVIRIVVAHPLITEPDVVRLAAHRPALPAVVHELTKAWAQHARVRLALVLNPGCPLAIAIVLLPLLSRSELDQVIRGTNLAPAVRATAHELHQLRPPIAYVEEPALRQ